MWAWWAVVTHGGSCSYASTQSSPSSASTQSSPSILIMLIVILINAHHAHQCSQAHNPHHQPPLHALHRRYRRCCHRCFGHHFWQRVGPRADIQISPICRYQSLPKNFVCNASVGTGFMQCTAVFWTHIHLHQPSVDEKATMERGPRFDHWPIEGGWGAMHNLIAKTFRTELPLIALIAKKYADLPSCQPHDSNALGCSAVHVLCQFEPPSSAMVIICLMRGWKF